jgi:DDE superfamily endonuclease/Transposase
LKTRRTWLRKAGSRGKCKLKKQDKLSIYQTVANNPFLSSHDIVKKLKLSVSYKTVQRYLKQAGFIRRKPHTKLDLTETHIQTRYFWAANMRSFRYWGEVIFTDETSIWLNDNGHEGWFNNQNDHPLSFDKHSGKLHVWGAVTIFGKLTMRVFRDNFNSLRYLDILKNVLTPAANSLYPNGWILLQDGSPCHKGDSISYLYYGVPYVLSWPSKSPDVNPIENVWHLLKSQVRKRFPKDLDELEKIIHEEWNNLDDKIISNIACSFQLPCRTLFNRKGHSLKS